MSEVGLLSFQIAEISDAIGVSIGILAAFIAVWLYLK